MTAAYLVVGAVILQRLLELLVARRNTRKLMAQGAVEYGAGHYPFLVLLHAAWLAALVLSITPATTINWYWLGVYALLQIVRVWTMASLGRFWTTRIIILPTAPLRARGPYKFLRHPNYVIVAGEIAVLPLVFGLWQIAAVFSIANVALMRVRLACENATLAARRSVTSSDS